MIYELRSYVLASERFAEYVGTFSERPAVVEVLRPYLRGFWSSESGILNRVMHLYEYRDRAERLAVRTARAQVPVMRSFYADVLPMLRQQRSVIYEGKVASSSAAPGGVYDRLAIALAPGVSRERSERLTGTVGETASRSFEVAATLQSRLLEQTTAPACEVLFLLRSASLEQRRGATAELFAKLDDPSVSAVETDLWTPLAFSPLQ
jgi:hypothetical protein